MSEHIEMCKSGKQISTTVVSKHRCRMSLVILLLDFDEDMSSEREMLLCLETGVGWQQERHLTIGNLPQGVPSS